MFKHDLYISHPIPKKNSILVQFFFQMGPHPWSRNGKPPAKTSPGVVHLFGFASCYQYQWIVLREILQENPIFSGKNHGFL